VADPQLEDGHLRLANELYEAWTRTRVPGEAEQVLKAIIRKTYGFNKKADRISISQIAAMTRMSSGHVCRAIKILLNMNMITKKGSTIHPTYGVQKNYDKWKALPKKVYTPNTVVPKKGNTKDITYKDIKDYPRKGGEPDKPPGKEDKKTDKAYPFKWEYVNGRFTQIIGCDAPANIIGLILSWGQDIGETIVAIHKIQTWTTEKQFVGAIRDTLRDRGKWSDENREMVKLENSRFDKWLGQRGMSIGDIVKKL
jgi:phage replication O-like protein O